MSPAEVRLILRIALHPPHFNVYGAEISAHVGMEKGIVVWCVFEIGILKQSTEPNSLPEADLSHSFGGGEDECVKGTKHGLTCENQWSK